MDPVWWVGDPWGTHVVCSPMVCPNLKIRMPNIFWQNFESIDEKKNFWLSDPVPQVGDPWRTQPVPKTLPELISSHFEYKSKIKSKILIFDNSNFDLVGHDFSCQMSTIIINILQLCLGSSRSKSCFFILVLKKILKI